MEMRESLTHSRWCQVVSPKPAAKLKFSHNTYTHACMQTRAITHTHVPGNMRSVLCGGLRRLEIRFYPFSPRIYIYAPACLCVCVCMLDSGIRNAGTGHFCGGSFIIISAEHSIVYILYQPAHTHTFAQSHTHTHV